MKVFSTLVDIFRRKWTKSSAFSYDDFEITDFDHMPYVDYSFDDAEEGTIPNAL